MKLGFVSAILPELVTWNSGLAIRRRGTALPASRSCAGPSGKAERKYAGITHIDVDRLHPNPGRRRSTRLCARHGVAISGLGYYPNPLDPDPAAAPVAVDHLKKVIVAAEKLGLKNVNTFVGRDWTQAVEENWPRFLKTWKPLIAFAEDHDIQIGIENCPMLFSRDEWPGGKNLMTTPVIWRRAFSDIPSKNFGLNYDPSHFILQHMDPVSPVARVQDKLFHLHAKDVRIRRERINDVGVFAVPLEWHQPRIPGYGDMDWARFMAR
jgi:sugar phosphate isomerase/epimerase